jgi:hypothetical protein
MKERYLEVTFRRGKPLAAYLYLPRQPGDVSARSQPREEGLVLDYAADGRLIGVEITAPSKVSLSGFNRTLAAVGQEAVSADDLAPLLTGPARATTAS